MKNVRELTNQELVRKLQEGSSYYPAATLIWEIVERFGLYVRHGDISNLDAREHIEGAWMEDLEDEEPEIPEPHETLRR